MSLTVEEIRKIAVQLQRPVKTEWNSQVFIYFQGDMGSVVGGHFSMALSHVKSPQD